VTRLSSTVPDNITLPELEPDQLLRYPTLFGFAVQWLAPLGLFRFSYGIPVNAVHTNYITAWPDQTEGFQFSVGNAF
jgi:outer membrane protein assembly factor BamA